MDKVLFEAAEEVGYRNTNGIISNYEKFANIRQINLRRRINLENKVKIQQQKDLNSELKMRLNKELQEKLEDITRDSQNKVKELEIEALQQRKQLLQQLAKKQNETSEIEQECQQIIATISAPIPKYNHKVVKEFSRIEKENEDYKLELAKLKDQLKSQKNSKFKATFKQIMKE